MCAERTTELCGGLFARARGTDWVEWFWERGRMSAASVGYAFLPFDVALRACVCGALLHVLYQSVVSKAKSMSALIFGKADDGCGSRGRAKAD